MCAMHTTHVQFSNSVMAETVAIGDADSTEAITTKSVNLWFILILQLMSTL